MNDHTAEVKTDPLTGLSSRLGIEDFLKGVHISTRKKFYVASVELARFGNLNDSMGSDLANKIIATTAKRLQKIFDDADLIGRTHGDHFCLIFSGQKNWEEIIERLQDFTQRPIALRGQVIVLSVRVGFADTDDVDSNEILLNAAEAALHRAKIEKRKSLHYTSSMTSDAKKSHGLENDLRLSLVTRSVELHRALHNDEFKIFYQPILDPRDGSVHAYEALLRWMHPQRGMVSPAEFIPLAEKIQVIDVLSHWVNRTAMKDALQFPINLNGKYPGVSVNVSPFQFVNPSLLVNSFNEALNESGIDPALVKLEVTESTTFANSMSQTLVALKALGIQIALDDFGTGYSSLTQMTRLPIDVLKIDRSFTFDLGSKDPAADARSEKLYKAIFALAEAFSMSTIVEGVETEEQLRRITSFGADFIQGFYYSKPMPLDAVLKFQVQK